jgi:hypothetical protein
MPYNGRDTYYLELMIASCSIMMAIMCLFYLDRTSTIHILYAAEIDIPVWIWGGMWTASGVALIVGRWKRSHFICEWSALYTASLWTIILYAAWSNRLLFPLSSALSPCFIFFSAMIYIYRTRVGRGMRQNARTAAYQ